MTKSYDSTPEEDAFNVARVAYSMGWVAQSMIHDLHVVLVSVDEDSSTMVVQFPDGRQYRVAMEVV